MSIRVFIDGEVFDETTARVSVFDRGFLYGDSVYEVTRTILGLPVDLSRHLERLERSAAAIGFIPVARERVQAGVQAVLAAAGNADSYLRIVLTRGSGEFGLDPALAVDEPSLIVIARPLHLPPAEQYENGVDVALVPVRRNHRRALDPAIKSGNYLNNILALAAAKRARAQEAIMCNASGWIVEGSTSNIFVVRDGAVRTPAFEDGLLDGITRRRVLELAESAGISAGEAHLGPDDLRGADEAFLTSSLRGVLPITRVDGVPLKTGRPGTITRQLMELYDRFLGDVGAGKLAP